MTGLAPARMGRLRQVLSAHVESGRMPGVVALVHRHGETQVETVGDMAFDRPTDSRAPDGRAPDGRAPDGRAPDGGPTGSGSTATTTQPAPEPAAGERMHRDTVFRISSMTKPITAAAAMILVEECQLRLDDPVDPQLPELAGRRVLRDPAAALADTVPAHRPITVRDLLTSRMGIGAVLAPPDSQPIQQAMQDAGVAPSADPPRCDPDEWLRRLGELPLVHQPGERFMYHTAADVLGVLVSRVTGMPLGAFLEERLFAPLGMKDTGFHVPQAAAHRFPPAYRTDPATGTPTTHDDPLRGRWSAPPAFASGGGGLVSTADDYLAFLRMMLGHGQYRGERVLSRPSVELMSTNHLTPSQRTDAEPLLGDALGWGFGMAVTVHRRRICDVPGRFGWDGGYGTSAYADPQEGLVGVLMTQRMMDSPSEPAVFQDFWTTAYQAIND